MGKAREPVARTNIFVQIEHHLFTYGPKNKYGASVEVGHLSSEKKNAPRHPETDCRARFVIDDERRYFLEYRDERDANR